MLLKMFTCSLGPKKKESKKTQSANNKAEDFEGLFKDC